MLHNVLFTILLGSLLFTLLASAAASVARSRPALRDVVFRTLFLMLALLPVLALTLPRPLAISVSQTAVDEPPPLVRNVPQPHRDMPPFPEPNEFALQNGTPESEPRDSASPVFVTPTIETETKTEVAKPKKIPVKMPHWSVLALGLWLCGMVPGLILLLHNIATYRRVLRRCETLTDVHWLREIAILESRLGLRRKISYKISDEIDVPQVVGVFRPTILLSRSLVAEKPDRAILIHELSHVERQDVFWQLFSSFVCLAYWFEPLVWRCAAGLRRVREEICDNQVLRLGEDGADYATTLLQMCSLIQRGHGLSGKTPRRIGCAVTASRTKNHLEQRIVQLLEPERKRDPMKKRTKILAVGAMLLLAAGVVVLCPVLESEILVAETRGYPLNEEGGDESTIRGRVLDEEKRPVAGIKVFALSENGFEKRYETFSDDDGRFSLPMPQSYGWDNVFAIDMERKLAGETDWNANFVTDTGREITITVKACSRTITGTVVDQNDRPVEGAIVGGGYSTMGSTPVLTDKDGKFEFLYRNDWPMLTLAAFQPGLSLGILATKEKDPYRLRGMVDLTPPEKPSDGPFHLKLTPTTSVKVRVVNEEGEPIAGALVGPWLIQKPPVEWSASNEERSRNEFNTSGTAGFNAVTDENGIAVLKSVPESFFAESLINAHGFWDRKDISAGKIYYGSSKLEQWKDVEIRDRLPTFVLPRLGYARITVRTEDGTPVPNVGIVLRGHDGSGAWRQTDKNGQYQMTSNVDKIYNLSFSSEQGVAPALFNFTTGDGTEEKQVDVTLKPGIRFYGKVFLPDGSPAEKFDVTVSEKDPNPPDSFRRPASDWSEWHSGKHYTTNMADRSVYPRSDEVKDAPPGEFETFLPDVPREYCFYVRIGPGPGEPRELFAWIDNVKLQGTEKEVRIDFHLEQDGKGTVTGPEIKHANEP